MELLTVTLKVKYSFNWGGLITINQIKEDIKALEDMGANSIEITSDDDDVYFEAFSTREETITEALARAKKQEYFKQKRIENDLRLLADLKAQYEK